MKNDRMHRTPVTVRGYELDSYGHVNNAVYIQYLEHARWMFMKDAKLLEKTYQEGLFLVVVETKIRYLRETTLFDELVVETVISEEKPYLVFRQKIRDKNCDTIRTRATVRTIFVDKNRTPVDIPDFISASIQKQ